MLVFEFHTFHYLLIELRVISLNSSIFNLALIFVREVEVSASRSDHEQPRPHEPGPRRLREQELPRKEQAQVFVVNFYVLADVRVRECFDVPEVVLETLCVCPTTKTRTVNSSGA